MSIRLLPLLFTLALNPARAAAPDSGDSCVPLARVVVQAAGLLSTSRRQKLVEPWLGRCIDEGLLQGLLRAIADDLLERGYITSRPYLSAQEIADGIVDITILPGRIEAIVDADTGAGNRRLAAAFLMAGEVLNLRQLETALETIERPASVSASFDIRPGDGQGASIVAVSLQEGRALALELSVNARSQIDTGLGLRLDWDNPLALNDILSIGVNQGQTLSAIQSTHSADIGYRIGLGGLLVELLVSEIEFEQRIQGINASFVSTGETRSERLGLSTTAWRGQRARLELSLALQLKDTRNFFDDEPIDVSSYRTSQLEFGVGGRWYAERGEFSIDLTHYRGLDDFGARDDDYYTRGGGETHAARLQFDKLGYGLALDRWLMADRWQWRSSLRGQHSDDLLFDSDKLNLGGLYTVRGYSSALAGANAWYWRNDLLRHFRGAPGKRLSLSLGLDHGEVECEADNPDACGQISGLGFGVDFGDANFSASLHWGHPLERLADGVGDEDLWQADLRWRL